MRLLFLSYLALSAIASLAQDPDMSVKKGNELYRQQQYEPAKAAYQQAIQLDSANSPARFNLANTDYRLAKSDEAIRELDLLATNSTDATDRSRAFYNKGAILSRQKKLEESIEAYKNALRQNPNDKEARENLQKALLELKKKNPPPRKESEQKKQQQNKQQQQQPRMNQKDAEQKLKLLRQKEKELQQKMQKKGGTQGGTPNDW